MYLTRSQKLFEYFREAVVDKHMYGVSGCPRIHRSVGLAPVSEHIRRRCVARELEQGGRGRAREEEKRRRRNGAGLTSSRTNASPRAASFRLRQGEEKEVMEEEEEEGRDP